MKWINYRSVKSLDFSRDTSAVFPERAIVALSYEERQAVFETILTIPTNPYISEERESFIASSKAMALHALTKATTARIRAELDSGLGAVLIRGLPMDTELPDTPVQGGVLPPSYKKTFVCEAILLALGCLTEAEPFNFRQEGRGSAPLIDNVVSVRKLRDVKGSGGYANNFPFHCESAWHRKRPDYVVLVGIREDPMAKTLVFSTEMFDATCDLVTDTQREGLFRVRGPELYEQMENIGIPLGTAKHVLLNPIQNNRTGLKLNLNFNGTDCANEAAIAWLSRLETYIEAKAIATVLGPGSALILNNHRTCHTRNGYSPSFDGHGRWFLRAYFKNDLWKSEPWPSNFVPQMWSDQDFHDLSDMGWMTETRNLTQEFLSYILQPNLIMSLGKRETELATIAFHFTPIKGTRIV